MLGFIYLFLFVGFASVPVHALPVPRGPRAVSFAADSRIHVATILAAAKNGKEVLATFGSGGDSGSEVKIFGDWLKLMDGGSTFYFTADMDVDCDGVDVSIQSQKKHQVLTSFCSSNAKYVVSPFDPFSLVERGLKVFSIRTIQTVNR
jgi:hypothetical protein